MGYDMNWHKMPAPIQEIADKLYGRVDTPTGEDRMKVVDHYFAERDKAGVYFRLNIGGMGRFAGYMAEMGMIYTVPSRTVGRFPRVEDFEFDGYSDDYYAASKNPKHPQYEQWKAHETAVYAHISKSFEHPGIPEHKFSTNDGWHVTPAECLSALEQYERNGGDDAAREVVSPHSWDYWKEWLVYLKRAAEEGEGFRVW